MLISNINVIRDKALSNRAVVKIGEAEYNKLTLKEEKDKSWLDIFLKYLYKYKKYFALNTINDLYLKKL